MSTPEEDKDKPLSAEQLEAQLQQQREQLAHTVDELIDQLDPKRNLAELKQQLSDTAANASDEAQAFITRLRNGDPRATQLVGITATAVVALVGIVLIRRR